MNGEAVSARFVMRSRTVITGSPTTTAISRSSRRSSPKTWVSRTTPRHQRSSRSPSQRSPQATCSAGRFAMRPCKPKASPSSSQGAPTWRRPQVVRAPPKKLRNHPAPVGSKYWGATTLRLPAQWHPSIGQLRNIQAAIRDHREDQPIARLDVQYPHPCCPSLNELRRADACNLGEISDVPLQISTAPILSIELWHQSSSCPLERTATKT